MLQAKAEPKMVQLASELCNWFTAMHAKENTLLGLMTIKKLSLFMIEWKYLNWAHSLSAVTNIMWKHLGQNMYSLIKQNS